LTLSESHWSGETLAPEHQILLPVPLDVVAQLVGQSQ
jgi:hypothetical protein